MFHTLLRPSTFFELLAPGCASHHRWLRTWRCSGATREYLVLSMCNASPGRQLFAERLGAAVATPWQPYPWLGLGRVRVKMRVRDRVQSSESGIGVG
eukprot:scaffold30494_cov72-Phaeocystis_antarctica.AAC.3